MERQSIILIGGGHCKSVIETIEAADQFKVAGILDMHVSTGAVINGGSIVEDGALMGSNSTIVNGITIAARSVIGAGSVINRSITQPGIYVGNPGRIIT